MGAKFGKLLYGEADAQVLAEQKRIFEKAGYAFVAALGRQAIENAARLSRFDLVILGHTLTKDDRHHLPYKVKKANPAIRVLVLHASGKHPSVDLAIDSRRGERAVLEAVAALLALREPGKTSQVSALAIA